MESEIPNCLPNQENRETVIANQIAIELRWRLDRIQNELYQLKKTMLNLSMLLQGDPEDVPF